MLPLSLSHSNVQYMCQVKYKVLQGMQTYAKKKINS